MHVPAGPPLRPSVEEAGLVFAAPAEDPHRRIAFFPSLCLLHDGTIITGFQNGPGKNAATSTIGLARSADGGRSWTPLEFPFEMRFEGVPGSLGCAELVEATPGRLLLFATWWDRTDPERPLFDPVTEGILHSRQLVAESTDGGDSWSRWRDVPTGGLRGCSLTGPVVRWDDGTIGVPFESFRLFDDPDPRHHAAWLVTSRDGGRTFSPPILVAEDPRHVVYYWDQRLCAGTEPGSFTALFWSHDLVARQDLTVHVRRGRIGDEAVVGDPPVALPIPGQIAAPVDLGNGRLLAFVVDRGRPGTMTLWSSADGGRSWPEASRLVVYLHDERAAVSGMGGPIDFAEYWEDMGKWSFGHPVVRRLPDGRLLAAWYAGTPDRMSIHWARIAIE
jgi:hypothetical protein